MASPLFGNARRLSMLEDESRSSRIWKCAGSMGSRNSGGTTIFTPKAKRSSAFLIPALNPGSDVSTNSDPKYTITYGTYGSAVPTIDGTPLSADTTANVITFGATDTYAYVQCDFTYDQYGTITITDAEIMTGSGSVPATTVTDGGMGRGGSGTLYQILYGVTITAPVGSGPYTMVAAPGVSGSQTFNICLAGPSINGPGLV